MSLDEALFERRAMYSPDRAVQKYVNEYGKKEFINGYDVGYIDGLNAAREVVELIPAPYKVVSNFETYGPYHEGRSDMKDMCLSAIDAIKGDSDG